MKFYKYIIDCIISWFLNISLYNLYKAYVAKIISIYKLLFFSKFDRKTKLKLYEIMLICVSDYINLCKIIKKPPSALPLYIFINRLNR